MIIQSLSYKKQRKLAITTAISQKPNKKKLSSYINLSSTETLVEKIAPATGTLLPY